MIEKQLTIDSYTLHNEFVIKVDVFRNNNIPIAVCYESEYRFNPENNCVVVFFGRLLVDGTIGDIKKANLSELMKNVLNSITSFVKNYPDLNLEFGTVSMSESRLYNMLINNHCPEFYENHNIYYMENMKWRLYDGQKFESVNYMIEQKSIFI